MSKALLGTNNINLNTRHVPGALSFHDDYATFGGDNGVVQFTSTKARYVEDRGVDVHSYVQALEASLDATFNDGEFAECINQHVLSAEFRPFNTDPTPVIKHVLKDRAVTFLRNGHFDPAKDAPKVDATSGDMLMVKPSIYTDANGTTRTGVLASMSTRVYDHAMMAGWTDGALEMSIRGIMTDFSQTIIDNAVKILAQHEDLQTVTLASTASKPRDIAEEVLDAIALNLPLDLGSSTDDFCIAMSERMHTILDRGAQAAGHEDASSMLGSAICSYSGDGNQVYLVPKGYSMLSFRSDKYGDTVRITATRNAQRACYDIELTSVFEVMAYGMVKVKDKANFDVLKDASFPLVYCLEFTRSGR